ncbi:MAG: cache domain-containing protein [Bdellovibrionales bacterium]
MPFPPIPATLFLLAIVAAATVSHPAQAADRATKEEAQTMVKKAIATIKEIGAKKAYQEISEFEGDFFDRDLYLVVIDMEGNCLASGSRSVPVGKNLLDFKDIDSKALIKERLEIAKTKSAFWQSYKFLDPFTRRVFPKQAYCETHKKTVICGGIYSTP